MDAAAVGAAAAMEVDTEGEGAGTNPEEDGEEEEDLGSQSPTGSGAAGDDDDAHASAGGPGFAHSSHVLDAPADFDLEAYAGLYSGQTRVDRLQYVAEVCPPLQQEAKTLGVAYARSVGNTTALKAFKGKNMTAMDWEWVDAANTEAASKLSALDRELSHHKASMSKEGIRQSYMAMGDHLALRGELQEALKCYVRMRDYCSTAQHSVQMCIKVTSVALRVRNYAHVANYVMKLEHIGEASSDPIISAQLKVASGLMLLDRKDYRGAARKFTAVGSALGDCFNEVVALPDIAVYGVLCALASLGRQEIEQKCLKPGSVFREILDTTPNMHDAVQTFHESRYSDCLELLKSKLPQFRLDLFLSPHAVDLVTTIRSNCLVQHFMPYRSLRLASMAEAVGMDPSMAEELVRDLIASGRIAARIDAKNSTLHARTTEKRSDSYAKIITMGRQCQHEARSLLLRMSCLQHDFTVRGRGTAAHHVQVSGSDMAPNPEAAFLLASDTEADMDFEPFHP